MLTTGKGKLFLNTGVLTGSNLLTKITAYIYFWIIAREFSAEQLGIYALLITSYLLLELVVNFGFDKIIIRELSRLQEDEANAVYFFSFAVRTGLAVVSFIGCLIAYQIIYPEVMAFHTWEVLFVLTAVFPLIISRGIESYFTAREKMHIPAASQLVERLLMLTAAGLVSAGIIGFRGFLAGFFLAAVVRMLILALSFPWNSWYRRSVLTRNRRRALFFEAGQVALVEISALIYFRVDVLMLSRMTDFANTGMYQVAYKIFDFFIALFAGFLIAVFPKISREGSRVPTGRYLWVGMLVMSCLAILVIFLRREVLAVFQPAFVAAEGALSLLMLALPLVFWNSLLTNYLVARGRVATLVRLAFVFVPLNIVLNFFFIPRFGIHGAAATTLLCELSLTGLFIFGLKDINRNTLSWKKPPKAEDLR